MNRLIRIDHDDTGIGVFKVTVAYQEADAANRLGESAEVVVYVDSKGRNLPESAPDISNEALAKAHKLLENILDEAN